MFKTDSPGDRAMKGVYPLWRCFRSSRFTWKIGKFWICVVLWVWS